MAAQTWMSQINHAVILGAGASVEGGIPADQKFLSNEETRELIKEHPALSRFLGYFRDCEKYGLEREMLYTPRGFQAFPGLWREDSTRTPGGPFPLLPPPAIPPNK